MTDNSIWYLENIDVTGIFCPKKLGNGQHLENAKTFKRGEYVYLPKEEADKIYFINVGKVKIGTYSEDGKEITKALLGVGEVFGELAVMGEKARRDFAVAMEKTQVCVVTRKEMEALMRNYTGLQRFIMQLISGRLLKMEQRLESLVFKDSRTRIVEFLRELAEEKGQPVGFEVVVRKFMTHQEIANLTATSRQTVTTVLNELRNKNIITFDRRRLLIRDMKALV